MINDVFLGQANTIFQLTFLIYKMWYNLKDLETSERGCIYVDKNKLL